MYKKKSIYAKVVRGIPMPCSVKKGYEKGAVTECFRTMSQLLPFLKNGRDDRIRTCDLIVPNDALYQAEPHPDNSIYYTMRL